LYRRGPLSKNKFVRLRDRLQEPTVELIMAGSGMKESDRRDL
jgi:hypothetical protein